MKAATFQHGGVIKAGVAEGDAIAVCASGPAARTAVRALIEGGETALSEWQDLCSDGAERVPLSEAALLAPLPEPRRDLFCVGKNYFAHAAEFHSSGFDSSSREEVPEAPVVFTKATTAVIGPGTAVRVSLDPTRTVDYEGELAVVIGRPTFQVSKAAALDHVFGYTIVNDVTSRALQKKHNQWVIGKSLDTFGPMGPYIVTRDEVGPLEALRLVTRVNGEVRQDASLADLIFDVPTLIETLSATMTLLPGDVIATGTPVGVGIGFDPPRYLAPGDRVSISITNIGELINPTV